MRPAVIRAPLLRARRVRIVRTPALMPLLSLLRLARVSTAATFATALAAFAGGALVAVAVRMTRAMFLSTSLRSLSRTLASFFSHGRRGRLEVRHSSLRHRLANHLLDIFEQTVLVM